MKNAEMQVLRFDAGDVIATSCGGLGDGWSQKSYKSGDGFTLSFGVEANCYDEVAPGIYNYINGVGNSDDSGNIFNSNENTYYHYHLTDKNGDYYYNFWICTNPDHYAN